jgi:hypothetical protein
MKFCLRADAREPAIAHPVCMKATSALLSLSIPRITVARRRGWQRTVEGVYRLSPGLRGFWFRTGLRLVRGLDLVRSVAARTQ